MRLRNLLKLLIYSQNPLSLPYDTSKIVLCGDSAGGNIATVCSINAKIKKTPIISLQV